MSDEMLRHSPSFRPPDGRRAQTEQTVLHLGDTTLTGGELADRISQYFQAFEALGEGSGATVGLLSLNRPEVLMIIGVDACRIGLGVASRQVILPVVL